MKYNIKLIVLCFTYHAIAYSSYQLDNFTNQTFMFTKTLFNSIGIQQASWYDFGYKTQKLGTSFQMYPLYSNSFNTCPTAEYFLFDYKHELAIQGGINPSEMVLTTEGYFPVNPKEDQITTSAFDRDILGQWFNFYPSRSTPSIPTSNALFTVNPKQTQASFIIELNQQLKKIINCSFADRWYVTFKVPVTYVCNNLGLQGNATTIDILTHNNNFDYVNFSNKKQTSTCVTNCQIILGTKYLSEEDSHIITGTGLVIPLVQETHNYYLFEPLNGFNGHLGLTGLALFQFPIIQKNDLASSRVCFFFEFENNFLARNFQMRTYDLRGKPYSRYMKLLDRKLNATVPAMNVLTIRSRVEPFNIFNMATGLRLKYKHSCAEIGYELWAHSSEVITPDPKEPWPDDRYGIAFINEFGELAKVDTATNQIVPIDTTIENGQTASNSTINYIAGPDGLVNVNASSNLTFTPKNKYVTLYDLDNFVPSARAAIVNRAYITIGYGDKGKNKDMFANIGLYIESSQNNAALSMWGVWAKMGLTF